MKIFVETDINQVTDLYHGVYQVERTCKDYYTIVRGEFINWTIEMIRVKQEWEEEDDDC